MFGIASQSYRVGMRPGTVTSVVGVTSLQVWYNADIANTTNFGTGTVNDNDPVAQWKDRSGTGHDLNKAGNNAFKPKWRANQSGVGNTLGVIRFDGVDESLDINPISWLRGLSGFSLFIVAKASTVGVSTRTICSTDAGGFQISHNSSNWRVEAAGCSGVSTVTGVGDTSKFNIYSLIFDGSGIGNTARLKFRYNRNEYPLTYTGTASTITSNSASTFYVGVGSAGNSQYFTGDIAEIVMFTRTVNSSELSGVEDYLRYHWNL